MKITVGQIGARMYYGIPQILHSQGHLLALHTDFVINKPPFSLIKKLAGEAIQKRLGNRSPEIEKNKIFQIPLDALQHLYALHIKKLKGIELHKEYLRIGKALEQSIIKNNLCKSDAVFIIGSTSAELFKRAKLEGVVTIQESIIAPSLYTLEIMQSEWEHYKTWEDGKSEIETLKFWGEINEKDCENADIIVCGSQFVADAFKHIGGPSEKCKVVPYGVPMPQIEHKPKDFSRNRPLRVITVGSVGLRKGSHYIVEAANKLQGTCEFKIAGGFRSGLLDSITFTSNLEFLGHVPRADLKQYYEWADVFLLPSLSEGSATVCYEALGYGLPLIVTHNTGQFITDGKEGFIIPIKSSNAIVQAIEKIIAKPDCINSMSQKAYKLSHQASYDAYKERIINLVNQI